MITLLIIVSILWIISEILIIKITNNMYKEELRQNTIRANNLIAETYISNIMRAL